MRKLTLITIAVAFTLACVGLYYLILVSDFAWQVHRPGLPVPELTEFCYSYRVWVLAAPVPILGWSVIALRGTGPGGEHVAFFAAVASLLMVVLFFATAVALVLPWACYID
jgi:hypothetical protein